MYFFDLETLYLFAPTTNPLICLCTNQNNTSDVTSIKIGVESENLICKF